MTTNSEVADVLRAAHDEMLIRGRTTGVLVRPNGEVCLEGAIAVALGLDIRPCDAGDVHMHNAQTRNSSPLFLTAKNAMATRGYGSDWNDNRETSDDDVLDAFLDTEKQLREIAGFVL